MKRKKLLAVACVCALAITMAAGCGNDSDIEEITDTEVTPDDVESDLIEEGDIDLSKGEQIAGFSSDNQTAEGTSGQDEDADDGEDDEDEPEENDPNLFTNSQNLNDDGSMVFNFEAQKDHVSSIPESADMQVRAGDLKSARWEALKIYYEGDEADAQEEMDDLNSAPAVTDASLKKIEPYYPQIARYIKAAGITSYDMTLPYYEDEEEVDYDMYTADYTTYYLSIYFKEDGSIESFEMFEEDADDDEFDEADDEDDDDDVIIIDDEDDEDEE